LVIGQTAALSRWIECRKNGPVYVSAPARRRITNNRYRDMMKLPVAQVWAQGKEIQKSSVGQLKA
jgi:hypothetical protein